METLEGWGASGSLSGELFSASISTAFCQDDEGKLTGDISPLIYEFGITAGTPQVSTTVTHSTLYGKNSFFGDVGSYWGKTIYDWTH